MTKSVNAASFNLNTWNDGSQRSYPMTQAATPTFSPAAGSYSTAQNVTISDSTPGVTIYYTTDGSTPTTASAVYSSPILVNATQTIKAIAVGLNNPQSAVGSAAYTITATAAATPTFSPAAGSYATSQTVTINCSTPSSTIYYTTDGSTPTTSSAVYTSALTVSASEVINAIATATGYAQSSVGTAAYTIGTIQGTYLAAGHWVTKLPLRIVYPRPDAETNTWARHHSAYWDGIVGLNYRIPITVTFGGYPYLYQLISGPPGMALVLPNLSSGPPYPDAYVTWTPTGAWSGTVTVRVFGQDYQNDGTSYVDVSWSLATSSSNYIFIDAVNGSDTTGTGTRTNPWQTFTYAFGTTYAASVNAKKICYARTSGTGAYSIPGQTDNPIGGGLTLYAFNTQTKPCALIGYPGDVLPKFDQSVAMLGIPTGGGLGAPGADVFIQDINFDGYQASNLNSRMIWDVSSAPNHVYDGLVQTNAGYGSQGGGNAGGIMIDGAMTYAVINNCSQSFSPAQQGPPPGDNLFGVMDGYYATDLAIHGCVINQPTVHFASAGAIYQKSDISYGSTRGCYANIFGGALMFSTGQAVLPKTYENELCYNVGVSNGGASILLPDISPFTQGNGYAFRNNILTVGVGLGSNSPNSNLVAPQLNAPVASTTGGSLAAQTYYAKITVNGVTGETTATHEVSVTTTGTTGSIAYSWPAMPFASSYNIYIGTSSNGENLKFNVGNVTSFTYTGQAGTAATPPSSNNAVSNQRFNFDANVVQTSNATPGPPTGGAIQVTLPNTVASSGLLNSSGYQLAPNGETGAEIL